MSQAINALSFEVQRGEIIAQLNREQQVSFLIAEQNINVALDYASHG